MLTGWATQKLRSRIQDNKESCYGSIIIGGNEIDCWSLRTKCSFPPILIFSACDTCPLDGGHGSIANAAFTMGAKAVLASTLPVSALLSASLISRLIFRVFEFLPIIIENTQMTTWRDVVSGMLRMAYVTEMLAIIINKSGQRPSIESIMSTQLSITNEISKFNGQWYETFLHSSSILVGLNVDQVKSIITKWGMTDALKYVQLGSPENIVITHNYPIKS